MSSTKKQLRIPKHHAIPSEVLAQINAVVKPTETVRYEDVITYEVNRKERQKNHADRADSYTKAFEYLINAHPPLNYASDEARQSLLAWVKKQRAGCDFSKLDNVKNMKSVLVKYLQHLIAILTDICQWERQPDFEEANEWLNDAEQFYLMQTARPDIATIIHIPLNAKKSFYMLNWDKSIPFHDEAFIEELKQIKAKQAPLSPEWFRSLTPVEKSYLAKLPDEIVNSKDLVKAISDDLAFFANQWNLLKSKLGNELETALAELREQGFSHLLEATIFATWPARYKILLLYTASKAEIEHHLTDLKGQETGLLHFIHRADKTRSNDLLKQALSTITQLPLWYLALPEHQQCFLRKNIHDAPCIEKAIQQVGSRSRMLLGVLANRRRHKTMLWESDGTLLASYEETEANSHLVPRDLLAFPELVDEQTRRSLDILLKETQPGQPLFCGTLISPVEAVGKLADLADSSFTPKFVSKRLKKLPPDYLLHRYLLRAINNHPESERIYQTNNSLNAARYVNTTSPESSDSMRLLQAPVYGMEKSESLELLEKVYGKLMESGWFSGIWRDAIGREFCFGSMNEQVAVKKGMKTVVTCMSSKDRRAVIFMLTDAMRAFNTICHKWPIHIENEKAGSPRDKELFITAEQRKFLVHIFCCILLCGHHQAHLKLSAPGTDLQNADQYLPGDVRQEVCRLVGNPLVLEEASDIATYNELSKLVKEAAPYSPKLRLEIAAFSCSSEDGGAFLTKLHKYIHQDFNTASSSEKYRKSQVFFASAEELPIVIVQLRELIKTYRSEDKDRQAVDLPVLLAGIFAIVENADTQSNPHVQNLCQIIRAVYTNVDSLKQATEKIDISYWQSTCRNEELLNGNGCYPIAIERMMSMS